MKSLVHREKNKVLFKRKQVAIVAKLLIEASSQALPLAAERSHLQDYHHPNPALNRM